ncbi:MAG: hypothetical protein BV458_05665 [Thermoplasmata archaeon M9B2D]|nr:MAG: hypothetical protein BV458_05665 [Thermoplasmata archaeon M9B2D]
MEKNLAQFILENIFLFLPIVTLGIVSTVVLMFISKKDNRAETENLESDFTTIFRIRLNIYFLVYLFIWIMILTIGLFSDFIIPTITGGIIATIPLVLLILVDYKTKKLKVR